MWLTGIAHGTWNIALGVILGTEISGQVIENSVLRTNSDPFKTLLNGGNFGLEGGLTMTIFTTILIIALTLTIRKKANNLF